MMQYEGRTWALMDNPPGAKYEDLEIVNCTFSGCSLGIGITRPQDRVVVRRVRLSDCLVDGGFIDAVVAEDVEIVNLRTKGSAGWVRGGLFKHVRLSGKFGTLSLTDDLLRLSDPTPAIQVAFDASAAAFYSDVDWAFDIREARFRELDWRLSLPARLVRRDPETQIVVTREKAAREEWRQLPLHATFAISLDMFLKRPAGIDTLLVAGRAASFFKQQLESIRLLREAGIAEPD